MKNEQNLKLKKVMIDVQKENVVIVWEVINAWKQRNLNSVYTKEKLKCKLQENL